MASRNDVSQGLQCGSQQMEASSDAPGADSRLSHQDKEDVGLVEYLRLCKAVAEEGQAFKIVHMVVGSDSCDLDSVVSSLVYAFHLWKINKDDTTAVIPILNIPKEDFALRGQVKLALEEQGIEQSTLLFVEDVDPVRYHQSGALALTLVDHQKPSGIFASCQDAVVEVIDHKMDAGNQNNSPSDKAKVTVEVGGSCATLIAGLLLTDLSATSSLTHLTAQLLYQTIVFDTLNFSPAGRVATPKDLHVAEQLTAMFSSRLSRQEIFQKLMAAKSDIADLSTELLLRKDMKIVEAARHGSRMRIAACNIPVLTKEYFASEKVQAEILLFCRHTGVVAAIILGSSLQLPISRDMLIYAEQLRVLNKIIYVLQTTPKVFLDLQKSGSFHATDHRFEHFQLGNSAVTLDVILPVIIEALTSLSNSTKPAHIGETSQSEDVDRAVPTSLAFQPVSPARYASLNLPDGPTKSPSARSPSRVLDQLKQEDFIPTETPWTIERSASPRNLPQSDSEARKYGRRTEGSGHDVVDGNPASQLAPEEDNKALMTPNNPQPPAQTVTPSDEQGSTDTEDDNENEKVVIEETAIPKGGVVETESLVEADVIQHSSAKSEDGKAGEKKRSKLDLGWLSSHWENSSPNAADIHNPALTDTVDGLEPGASSTAKTTPSDAPTSANIDATTTSTTATGAKATSPTKSPSFQATSTAAWFTSSASRPTCTPPPVATMPDSASNAGATTAERFPGMSPLGTSASLATTTPNSDTPWETFSKPEDTKGSVEVPIARSVSADKVMTENSESGKSGIAEKKGTDEVDVGPFKNSTESKAMGDKPDVVASTVRYSSLGDLEKNEKDSETEEGDVKEERTESRLDKMISPAESQKQTYPWSTPITSPQANDVPQKEDVSSGQVSPWDFEKAKAEGQQGGTVELGLDGGKTQRELDKEERVMWVKALERVGHETEKGKDEVDTGRGGRHGGSQLPKTPDAGKHLTERNVEDLPMEIRNSDMMVVEDKTGAKDEPTQNEKELEEIHFAFRHIADRKEEGQTTETASAKSEEALAKLAGSENMDSSTKGSSENDTPSKDKNDTEHGKNAKTCTRNSKSKALTDERTLSYDETAYPSAGYHILSDSNRRVGKSKSPEGYEESPTDTTSDQKVANGHVKKRKGPDAVDGPTPSPSAMVTLNADQPTSSPADVPLTVTDENKNQTDNTTASSFEKPAESNIRQADGKATEDLNEDLAGTKTVEVMSEVTTATITIKPKTKGETLGEIRQRQLEDQRRELFQQHRSMMNSQLDNVLSQPKGLDHVDSGKITGRMDGDGEDSGSSTASISPVRRLQPSTSEVSEKKEVQRDAGEKTPLLEKRMSVSGVDMGKGKTNEEVYAVDMAAIEPYSAVVSVHMVDNGIFQGALVCFYACYLPRRSTDKYEYLMQNIFRYFVGTLDFLDGRPCMVAYFSGAVPSGSYPTTSWLHQCYKMLDRRLEKNLQGVVIIHPTFWFKAQLQVIGRALVSGGFYHKVAYAENLDDLRSRLGLEDGDLSRMKLPLPVEEYDRRWFKKEGANDSPMAPRRFALLRKCSF
ncbi:hypothetical protein RvY_16584 [Ramazzottius varieornatus]|uniref:DHHA2 domain-containing protein n=1 Tax=Ramazzottius varieornatus TaxID=947166 RepID=A0A1D1W3A7_RAMVA|nr:hypothetical protein RvY_16584 [Ramazzottius varieornatus]